jgi:hypothetical protein
MLKYTYMVGVQGSNPNKPKKISFPFFISPMRIIFYIPDINEELVELSCVISAVIMCHRLLHLTYLKHIRPLLLWPVSSTK